MSFDGGSTNLTLDLATGNIWMIQENLGRSHGPEKMQTCDEPHEKWVGCERSLPDGPKVVRNTKNMPETCTNIGKSAVKKARLESRDQVSR